MFAQVERRKLTPLVVHAGLSAYVAAYAGLLLLILWKTDWCVRLNDFWGYVLLACKWEWDRPKTCFNGVHPLGYVVLLKTVCRPTLETLVEARKCASWINVVAAGLGLVATFGLAIRRLGVGAWALVAIAVLSIGPYFEMSLTQTADCGCTALVTLGLWLVNRSCVSDRQWAAPASAGLCLGLAALMRYYGVTLALGVAAGFLLREVGCRRIPRRAVAFAAAFIAIYSLQMAVNVLSGHGPLETDAALNIQVYHFGINWFDMPEPRSLTILGVIRQSPLRFLGSYISRYFEVGLLPLLLLTFNLLRARDHASRAFLMIMTTTVLAYTSVQALGGSPRGSWLLLPLITVEGVVAIRWLVWMTRRRAARSPITGALATAALISVVASGGVRQARFMSWRASANLAYARHLAQCEEVLKGDGVTDASQIFTSNGGLYLPGLGRPRINGGWQRYSDPEVAKNDPNVDTFSLAAFHTDCRRRGITHLVLDDAAAFLGEPLDSLHRYGERVPHPGFRFVRVLVPGTIYRVVEWPEVNDAATPQRADAHHRRVRLIMPAAIVRGLNVVRACRRVGRDLSSRPKPGIAVALST
jgi:Dolichyl-phosphate-mannose-protein mannosyltransferase